jgi:hypothetical protein
VEKKLILRGALVGALSGLLAFLFARIFAEPKIQAAIDYESGREAAANLLDRALGLPVPPAEADVFSRTIQANVGIGVGVVLLGMAMGALFAVTYTFCLGRVGRLRPRTLSMLVAGAGFLGFYLVPFIKYPSNPPSIGHGDTIRDRSNLYLLMVFVSIVFLVVAIWLGQRLAVRFGNWNASLLAGAGFIVAIGIVMALLPSFGELGTNQALYGSHPTETPLPLTNPQGTIVFPGFPADLLFDFRVYSVAAQLILWSGIGLLFAPMAERLLAPSTPASTERNTVDA